MLRSFFRVLGALGCVAGCAEENTDPATLDLVASAPTDAIYSGYYSGSANPRFAVGLRAELRVTGGSGYETLKKVTCTAGCSVETVPHPFAGHSPTFRVTPLATTFAVHASVLYDGVDSPEVSFDRELMAISPSFTTEHEGAVAGTPFLAGMRVDWDVVSANPDIRWEPNLSNVTATGPFVVKATANGSRLRVHVQATGPGRGRLLHRNGLFEERADLVAVDAADIHALHVARATQGRIPPLETASLDRVLIDDDTPTRLWVTFETKDGLYGIAGAGESLPEPGARFTVVESYFANSYASSSAASTSTTRELSELQSQPHLVVQPKSRGPSNLLLRVGDAHGVAEVVVR